MTELTEEWAQEELFRGTALAEAWIARSDGGFDVGQGSDLADDDAQTMPYTVSHALTTCLIAAIDHHHALLALVLKTDYLHLNAPATVARGALETACTAIWLAAPADRDERIRRTLCWFWKDAKDGDTAATGRGMKVPKPLADRQDELTTLATAQGLTQSIKGYTSTDAVTVAKEYLGNNGKMDVLLMWRVCSGFAHGRTWPQLGFSANERTPIPGNPDMVGVRFTSSYVRALSMVTASRQAIEAAIALFEERARGRELN
jgi:hypothetical protein